VRKYFKREVLFIIKSLKELKVAKYRNKGLFLIKNDELKIRNVRYLENKMYLKNKN
jgi:hypothetical protein